MNVSSLSLIKIAIMKASFLVKIFLVLPLILLVDYVLMAILGCGTCLFGFGNEFYCGPFCVIGKILLVLSAVFFGYLIYPDIKEMIGPKKNMEEE